MKKIISVAIAIIFSTGLLGQNQEPIVWSYQAKKLSPGLYQVVISARLDDNWHVYSAYTAKGGPEPTKIVFNKNPLLAIQGNITEIGKLETVRDKVFSVEVKYYADKVNFVQLVKVRNNVKTNITGSIRYMVCDDEQCYPPATKKFDIKLQ